MPTAVEKLRFPDDQLAAAKPTAFEAAAVIARAAILMVKKFMIGTISMVFN